jgi:hypothetical protein
MSGMDKAMPQYEAPQESDFPVGRALWSDWTFLPEGCEGASELRPLEDLALDTPPSLPWTVLAIPSDLGNVLQRHKGPPIWGRKWLLVVSLKRMHDAARPDPLSGRIARLPSSHCQFDVYFEILSLPRNSFAYHLAVGEFQSTDPPSCCLERMSGACPCAFPS